MAILQKKIENAVRRYRMVEKLAVGGMSVVCKAEHSKLRRLAALRFQPKEMPVRQQALGRFER